ncbi:hypothetical protein [Actinacidiphila oryziradicis]|uniref:Uncharacterized protein n=1 Tax=Actinacidiphila oryziradicis TaxID=2571141 RepID=A0A4U0SKA7_9ACTN|nr:hypothetical protein [Actinacidiphila oryziradicis]TKA00725.1 hypothetical protein FCI23_42150 [Actinacidiphila oryziradicis]
MVVEILGYLRHHQASDTALGLRTGYDRRRFENLHDRLAAGEEHFTLRDLHAVHAALLAAKSPALFRSEEDFAIHMGAFKETVAELAANLARAVTQAG